MMKKNKLHSILVVDDESANIVILEQILKPEYTVYTASSGQIAIEMAEEYKPDIILLDIVMPEMDGYEVISALKNSKNTHDIPVIFITMLTDDGDEEKGLKLGAADYITKPFSMENVRLRVKNQINTLIQLRSFEQLSMKDQLTGLNNRQNFEKYLHSEWEKALKKKTPISIMFIDVDNFKNYINNYGFPQGEVALKAIAKEIQSGIIRPDTFAARWSGEEFVVLLSNMEKNNALALAWRICRNVENMVIPCVGGLGAKITVSIGVNTEEYVHSSIDEFISGADLALQKAMAEGHNRVCSAAIP